MVNHLKNANKENDMFMRTRQSKSEETRQIRRDTSIKMESNPISNTRERGIKSNQIIFLLQKERGKSSIMVICFVLHSSQGWEEMTQKDVYWIPERIIETLFIAYY